MFSCDLLDALLLIPCIIDDPDEIPTSSTMLESTDPLKRTFNLKDKKVDCIVLYVKGCRKYKTRLKIRIPIAREASTEDRIPIKGKIDI